MFQKFSKGMFLPHSKLQWLLANTICKERTTQKIVCEKCIIFSVCGSDPNNFNSVIIIQTFLFLSNFQQKKVTI